MPIYEFKCTNTECENFDIAVEFIIPVEKYDDMKDKLTCEKCGELLRRSYSGSTMLVFKGAGFYVNDYKKKS